MLWKKNDKKNSAAVTDLGDALVSLDNAFARDEQLRRREEMLGRETEEIPDEDLRRMTERMCPDPDGIGGPVAMRPWGHYREGRKRRQGVYRSMWHYRVDRKKTC